MSFKCIKKALANNNKNNYFPLVKS